MGQPASSLNQDDPKAVKDWNDAYKAERQKAESVHTDNAEPKFLVSPNEAPDVKQMLEQRPSEKKVELRPKQATNEGAFSIEKLDNKSEVKEGKINEASRRAPAHERSGELAVEEDAPGFDTIFGITPRGNPTAGASDEEAKKQNEA